MLAFPVELVERLRPSFEGKAVCVTGGAGFIGGHLVDALLGLGASVHVIDDLSNSQADHLSELIEFEPDRVCFHHASILEESALRDAMVGCEYAFHLAAMASVPRSIEEPQRCYEVNTMGTLMVAQAAHQAGVQRVVYSASSSAYGNSEVLPKTEQHMPMPVSPYAASKLAGEHIMQSWAASYGLSTLCLRYFNIFGPRQPADSPYSGVIAVFAKRLLVGEQPSVFGDGLQTRDFTYVANAVLANLLGAACEKPLAGEVVNVGVGKRVTILDLHKAMAEEVGVAHVEPTHKPQRPGDVEHSVADIEYARQLIGYEPIVSLEEGLRPTLAWYKQMYADSAGDGGKGATCSQ